MAQIQEIEAFLEDRCWSSANRDTEEDYSERPSFPSSFLFPSLFYLLI